MSQLPEAHICHQSRERLRVKIPSKKGDAAYFSKLYKQLVQCKDIVKCEMNSLTGSILFIHNSDPHSIGEYIREHNLFLIINQPRQKTTRVHHQVATGLADLNKRLSALTGGGVDLWDVTFLALLSSGLFQIARGNFSAIPWYTAFWYAFGVFKGTKGGGE